MKANTKSIATKAAVVGGIIAVALGGVVAAREVAPDEGASATSQVTVFCSEFVPLMEESNYYSQWAAKNKIERDRWIAYRQTICLDQEPIIPEMPTSFGKALIAAGKMALAIDVPPGTTTTTTTTSEPTTTTTTTTTDTTTTTEPPPSVTYPPSYYTGPLGSGNVLPSKDGAFLITWINAPQSEGTGWPVHQAQMLEREAAIGRKYDGLMATDWQFEWNENHMPWIASGGRIPIVAGLNFGSSSNVLAGNANATIDAYANHYKAMPFKVIIRLNHEFNYCHTVYTSCDNTTGFINAWRHVVNRFKAAGANNVGWWWSPAEGGDRSRAEDAASYPGDDYVDWVGSDAYNWVFMNEALYATPYEPGWASFGKVFDYPTGFANIPTKHNTFGPRKPFIVGETGTVYDIQFPALKGQWYDAIPEYADAEMEWLRGVAFFDVNAAEQGESARNNWLVDHPISDPSAYNGFKALAADSFFNAK